MELEYRKQEKDEDRKERLEIQAKENEKFIEMMKVIMGSVVENIKSLTEKSFN
jgi:hypothetical protein